MDEIPGFVIAMVNVSFLIWKYFPGKNPDLVKNNFDLAMKLGYSLISCDLPLTFVIHILVSIS